jgi:predicted DsbA family dithiol-disulfide isomerase
MTTVRVQHFSDVLCVWAYVGQVRVDQLLTSFGDQVAVDYHFLDVFGDLANVESKWRDRGGLAAYCEHVKKVVERFEHVDVHDDVWKTTPPQTSMSCHLFLHAVGMLDEADALPRAAWAMREAFFRECRDISSRAVQCELAEQLGFDVAAIEANLASGRAHAALSADGRLAREQMVKMSPTFVFNDGRQRLAGNVGYRVVEANVRELLANPADEASWC